MMTFFTFAVALGILVVVHEWGHYIVAKLAGVWVEKFSIGFGPKIIGFHKNGTDYRLAPIPLGGYVKLYGQDPLEEADGDEVKALEIANDPRSFHSKSLGRKLATVAAGPVMNFILCLLIMPIVFMVGRMQPKILDQPAIILGVEAGSPAEAAQFQKGDTVLSFNGEATPTWQSLITQIALHPNEDVTLTFTRDGQTQSKTLHAIEDKSKSQVSGYLGLEPFSFFANEALIDTVSGDSPAERAGIMGGDKVLSIDGQEVATWSVMTNLVQKGDGKPLAFKVLRGTEEKTLSITPKFSDETKTWLIGISKKMNPDDFVKKQHGLVDAIKMGTAENIKLFGLTYDVIKRLVTGNLSYKSLGGPIQIAKATGAAAKSGFGDFVYLLAFLSMQLGFMNLLPIPVLDGGHIVFMLIEAARGKPLSPKVRQTSMQIGMAMLLGLMIVVTFNDISSTWGFGNIFRSIKGIF